MSSSQNPDFDDSPEKIYCQNLNTTNNDNLIQQQDLSPIKKIDDDFEIIYSQQQQDSDMSEYQKIELKNNNKCEDEDKDKQNEQNNNFEQNIQNNIQSQQKETKLLDNPNSNVDLRQLIDSPNKNIDSRQQLEEQVEIQQNQINNQNIATNKQYMSTEQQKQEQQIIQEQLQQRNNLAALNYLNQPISIQQPMNIQNQQIYQSDGVQQGLCQNEKGKKPKYNKLNRAGKTIKGFFKSLADDADNFFTNQVSKNCEFCLAPQKVSKYQQFKYYCINCTCFVGGSSYIECDDCKHYNFYPLEQQNERLQQKFYQNLNINNLESDQKNYQQQIHFRNTCETKNLDLDMDLLKNPQQVPFMSNNTDNNRTEVDQQNEITGKDENQAIIQNEQDRQFLKQAQIVINNENVQMQIVIKEETQIQNQQEQILQNQNEQSQEAVVVVHSDEKIKSLEYNLKENSKINSDQEESLKMQIKQQEELSNLSDDDFEIIQ